MVSRWTLRILSLCPVSHDPPTSSGPCPTSPSRYPTSSCTTPETSLTFLGFPLAWNLLCCSHSATRMACGEYLRIACCLTACEPGWAPAREKHPTSRKRGRALPHIRTSVGRRAVAVDRAQTLGHTDLGTRRFTHTPYQAKKAIPTGFSFAGFSLNSTDLVACSASGVLNPHSKGNSVSEHQNHVTYLRRYSYGCLGMVSWY
jgi:hypothetical protein